MPSQYIKDTYYKDGYRYVINGIPCRFEHPQSKHQLAVMAGQSNTKLLKEAEAIRHPQTTYGPAQDCVFNVKEGGRQKLQAALALYSQYRAKREILHYLERRQGSADQGPSRLRQNA